MGMTEEQRLIAWGDELVKLHDGFRKELARIRGAAGGGFDLRTHCLAFCDALHAHHEGEDAVLFPHLGAEYPELREVLTRLGTEHRVVARLISRIRDLQGGDEVGAELDRLADELEAHLDYEEEQLVPLLNQMTTLPEGV
jgi:iron-sulfur cluster repair protein YtfE (RIC family)